MGFFSLIPAAIWRLMKQGLEAVVESADRMPPPSIEPGAPPPIIPESDVCDLCHNSADFTYCSSCGRRDGRLP